VVKAPTLPSVDPSPAAESSEEDEAEDRKKRPRVNWAEGDNAVKLARAVSDWDTQSGDVLDIHGKKTSMRAFLQKGS